MKFTRALGYLQVLCVCMAVCAVSTSTLTAQTGGKSSGDVVLAGENNSDLFWEEVFTVAGVDGDVYAMVQDSEGNIYVGGDFTTVSGVNANNIAMWDGSAWSALGDGTDGPVYAIETIGLEVFVAGQFSHVGSMPAANVANWTNQTRWRTMGTGMSGPVYALERQGDNLVAGGKFIAAGGVNSNNIARWNGARWEPMGTGLFGADEIVYAVEVVGDRVYVGGSFGRASEVQVNNIAMFVDNEWSDMAGGVTSDAPNSRVYALEAMPDGIWVGGNFESAGSENSVNLARFDYASSTWANVNANANAPVRALKRQGDNRLFVGGEFNNLGGFEHTRVARISTGANLNISRLGLGVNRPVRSILVVDENTQYFGGEFSLAGSNPAASITRWNGSSYFTLSPLDNNSVDGRINSLLQLPNGDLVVAGEFLLAGELRTRNIASWDGEEWHDMAGGVNGEVFDLALAPDGRIYAGGDFTTAGVTNANRIACWDGDKWLALGAGMDNTVYAVEMVGNTVYAGGDFNVAGTTNANRLARWNGVDDWIPLAGGVDNRVTDMEYGSGRLVVVGWFETAGIIPNVGGVAAYRVENQSWNGFNTEIDGLVNGVALRDEEIYIVGDFQEVSGVNINGVARWTGRKWEPLGGGLAGIGNKIVTDDGELVVVGDFGGAGASDARNIARWTGGGWVNFGSGLNGPGYAVIATDDFVYAGGEFTLAGDKPSRNIGRWYVCNPDLRIGAQGPTRLCKGQSVQLIASGGFVSYQWSTGDESQGIEVDTEGTWIVTAVDERGCEAVATITTEIIPLPEPVILNDDTGLPVGSTIFLCAGEVVKFDGGDFDSFLWSTGARSRSIQVNQPGDYFVEVTDVNGCPAVSATVTVERLPVPDKPTITQDENELVSSSADSYQWYFEGQLIEGATGQRYAPEVEGIYSVEITQGGNGCTARSDAFNFKATSVDDVIGNAAFSVYPNPTSDRVVVGFTPENSGRVRIEVINSLGNTILSTEVDAVAGQRNTLNLSLADAADGVYFIQVNGLSNSQRLKLIKQR